MKSQILSLLAVACLLGTLFYFTTPSSGSLRSKVQNLKEFSLFNQWMSEYGRAYENEAELMMRFGIWYSAHHEIEYVNSQKLNYTFGHNDFSDLTEQEFSDMYLTPNMEEMIDQDYEIEEEFPVMDNLEANPKSVNWTAKGAVTKVVSQGRCGSCWAFAGVASAEGCWAIKTGNLVKMSEQQIIDCTARDCRGGWYRAVYNLYRNTKSVTAECYPYKAKSNRDVNGTKVCNASCPGVASTTGYVRSPAGDSNLETHAAKAVIAVAINVSPMRRYKTGVWDGDCNTRINHGVTLTGYGVTEEGQQYWVYKNSWGRWWGDKGYAKLAKGADTGAKGKCGISGWAEYPKM